MALAASLSGGETNAARADDAAPRCAETEYRGHSYVVCRPNSELDDVRLYLHDRRGNPYNDFEDVRRVVEREGHDLVFAMNGGMFYLDRSPGGLYVENGERLNAINTRDAKGNFYLKPNGVFFITEDGPGVLETEHYRAARPDAIYATQSGPMLIINGELHPRFLPNSDSHFIRNGVGVTTDGELVFAFSNDPVSFHQFAVFFLNELKTPNALYLEGAISRLYAKELDRNDRGVRMGPIVAAVQVRDEPEPTQTAGRIERVH